MGRARRVTVRELRGIIREEVSRLNEQSGGTMTITDLTWDPYEHKPLYGKPYPAMVVARDGAGALTTAATPEAFKELVQRIVKRFGDVELERVSNERDAHIITGSGFWRIVDPGWDAEAERIGREISRYYSSGRYSGD